MAEPFNFTTPINKNTTLVARYRCGSGPNPYGGDFFRMTTSDGNQYIPGNIEEAEAAAKIGFPRGGGYFALQNIATGNYESVPTRSVIHLELGGGWGYFGDNLFFPIGCNYNNTYDNGARFLKRLSGYPNGLTLPETDTLFCLWFDEVDSNYPRYQEDVWKAYVSMDLDITGLKFDTHMFERMMTNPSYPEYIYSLFSSMGSTYTSSDNYGGGAYLVMLNHYLTLTRLRSLKICNNRHGMARTHIRRIIPKVLVSVANMLKVGLIPFLLDRLSATLLERFTWLNTYSIKRRVYA